MATLITMPVLTGIWIYPIKSLRGIACSQRRVTSMGFEYDRRWMLVDGDGKFITQRQYPRMALIAVSLEKDSLCLEAPDIESLRVPIHPDDGSAIDVKVWNDQCMALRVGEKYDRWFSRFLDTTCRLVYLPDDTRRPVDPEYAVSTQDQVGFSDGFPFLLISEASLEDLNQRLAAKGVDGVPMLRFRPNLVLSGCDPYAEDDWQKIRIGDQVFDVVKPCSRCIIPTIDIQTGMRATNKEPLRTLMEYRKRDNKVYFGQNLIHRRDTGFGDVILSTGDSVSII